MFKNIQDVSKFLKNLRTSQDFKKTFQDFSKYFQNLTQQCTNFLLVSSLVRNPVDWVGGLFRMIIILLCGPSEQIRPDAQLELRY